MKLIYEKGRKGNGDRILKMTTTNREGNPIEREPFSIYYQSKLEDFKNEDA